MLSSLHFVSFDEESDQWLVVSDDDYHDDYMIGKKSLGILYYYCYYSSSTLPLLQLFSREENEKTKTLARVSV